MSDQWDTFLDSENNKSALPQFPNFTDLYSPSKNEKLDKTTHSLEIYLNLFSQGRSLLHNLKDRKEFYRPDLYEHLYENTMTKLQKSNKKDFSEGSETDDGFKPNTGGLKLSDIQFD